MESAVIQLQHDALTKDVPLADLLRRAYVVARKLGLSDFQSWIQSELNGYQPGDDMPDYRLLEGEVKGWNPFHGWISVIFESPEEARIASKRACGQSVAEFEKIVQDHKPGGQLHMPLPYDAQRRLGTSAGFDTQYTLFVPVTGTVRILDAVRNALLNWALKLEEDGVLGEGLTFTEREKQVVDSPSYNNVNNFFGNVGVAEVQQAGRDAVQIRQDPLNLQAVRAFVEEVTSSLKQLALDNPLEAELKSELTTLSAQLESPKPKKNILRQSLTSIRSILEAVGGGVGSQLLIQLGKVLLGSS